MNRGRKRGLEEAAIENHEGEPEYPRYGNLEIDFYRFTESQHIFTKILTHEQQIHRFNFMNWLTYFHWRSRLSDKVLWLAARYIDGYIEHDNDNQTLPLCVPASSLFLAIKFEERAQLRLNCMMEHIVGIGEDNYTSYDILSTEYRLLSIFNGMINVPTVHHFIEYYLPKLESEGVHIDKGIQLLSAYYAESTLLSTTFSRIKSSRVAVAVLFAAFTCRDELTCISSTTSPPSIGLGCNNPGDHSPVGVTMTLPNSPPLLAPPPTVTQLTTPPDPSSGDITPQIMSALNWQPSPLLFPGIAPHSLWLSRLCQLTGYEIDSFLPISKRIISRLVPPREIQHQESAVSFQKYSSWRRFSVCHLPHPTFSSYEPHSLPSSSSSSSSSSSLPSAVAQHLAPHTPL